MKQFNPKICQIHRFIIEENQRILKELDNDSIDIGEIGYNNNYLTVCAYHSSNNLIKNFDFENIDFGSGSRGSTRMDAIFFSNIEQRGWGDILYRVKITSKYPVYYDLNRSNFDSLSIQEAFDGLLRGITGHILEDIVINYAVPDDNIAEVEDIIEHWGKNVDLFVVDNINYYKHNTEYIVPAPHYRNNSASIKIIDIIR